MSRVAIHAKGLSESYCSTFIDDIADDRVDLRGVLASEDKLKSISLTGRLIMSSIPHRTVETLHSVKSSCRAATAMLQA